MSRQRRNKTDIDPQELIQKVVNYLQLNHSELVRPWFDQLEIIEISHGHMTIAAKSPAQYYYLHNHCAQEFMEAVQAVTGLLLSLDFVCINEDKVPDSQDTLILNEEFTFDSFVAGPSNNLAYAASIAVANQPGKAYNPLFIYGPVGLGKTHLLQAICHRIRQMHPAKRILYLSCEKFVNDFIAAVESGTLQDFRNRYRHPDVLVIDDVQFLANKDSSQEEFFHTFNSLYQEGKQIILSSDRPPGEIETLTERLVSRFNWGLVAMVDYPTFETRAAIIRKKSRMRGLELSDEVVNFLASMLETNIREIEGTITKLQGIQFLIKQPITKEIAKDAIPKHLLSKQDISLEKVAKIVAEHFNVKITELQSKKRYKSLTLPRQVCMFIARQLTKHSLEEIGGYFGGRDHSTVLHAIRTIEQNLPNDPALKESIETIAKQLGSNIELK